MKLERSNDSLLRPAESAVTGWLIKRYPAWITPDVLTYTSLLTGPLMLLFYWLSQKNTLFLWGASFFLIINWIADSTDGGLARYRNRPRPNYGHYVDHAFDMIVTMCIGLGLGFSPVLRMTTGIAIVFLFYLWSLHSSISSTITRTYRLAYFKLGPTELRLLILIGQTFWLFYPNIMTAKFNLVEASARWFIGTAGALLVFEAVKTIIKLRKKDEAKLAAKQ
ncbi:CDP-alcohol phosphatidyltransferase family protein [Candidatus Woesearchaeota archaeon]|nr:CDP-alcohol phosphatidyltransferase family protein [Candidatus Woesearchaeota archaeon]